MFLNELRNFRINGMGREKINHFVFIFKHQIILDYDIY